MKFKDIHLFTGLFLTLLIDETMYDFWVCLVLWIIGIIYFVEVDKE